MAAFQLSVACRNAGLDAYETVVGASSILKIRTGAQPSDCSQADSGTVLATVNLPTDWMQAASGGSKAKSGTWQDASADAGGTAGHFRIYDSTGAVCHMQGDVTITGNGGKMTVDNPVFAAGQVFTVTAFTLIAGNP